MALTKTALTFGAALGRGIVITGILVAALALQAQESQSQKSQERAAGTTDTATCLKEAAQMNAATIKFGQLGSQKAQNARLKQFSEEIERDHTKAQDKLETIAKQHNVVLPTSLDPHCQEELTKLQALSGAEFDKEFAKGAVQGHAQAIAKLRQASTEAKDSDLANYAKDMLSQMKRHQQTAREVAQAVGLDQAAIAALETQPPAAVGTSGTSSQTERGASSTQSSDQKENKDSTKDSTRQP
jgi:putative membrane protein